MFKKVYLALGSNMGDREENLMEAVRSISRIDGTTVTGVSDIYETEPVGYTAQGNFLNMVIAADTVLAPLQLLAKTQEIEAVLGRVREIRWGPRTVDIDILLYDNLQVCLPDLIIPHPRMLERAFVLVPLRDVYDSAAKEFKLDNLIDACHDKGGVKLFKKHVWNFQTRNLEVIR